MVFTYTGLKCSHGASRGLRIDIAICERFVIRIEVMCDSYNRGVGCPS